TVSAMSSPSPPKTTVTSSASSRALARISRVMGATSPVGVTSARTQMLESVISIPFVPARSENLETIEEFDDLLVGVAIVFDDLTSLSSWSRSNVDDFLASTGPADDRRVDSEITDGEGVDRLGFGGHD